MEVIDIDSAYAIHTKWSASAGLHKSKIMSSSRHILQENDTMKKLNMGKSPFHIQHSMVNELNKSRDNQHHR